MELITLVYIPYYTFPCNHFICPNYILLDRYCQYLFLFSASLFACSLCYTDCIMINKNILDEILKAKINNTYVHIENGHSFLIDWNEYINILKKIKTTTGMVIPEVTSEYNSPRYMYATNFGEKILRYEEFDYVFYNVNKANHVLFNIFELCGNFICKENLENMKQDKFSLKMISNLVGDEGGYWIHPDPHDVITLQMQGSVEYRIYENVPEHLMGLKDNEGLEYKSYILNPGDIFFMTAGTIHQAFVSGPRITTILDINKDIWDINPIAQ